MERIQKVYTAGELEHGVVRDVERHAVATANPATGAALRVASHAAKELLRSAPHDSNIVLDVGVDFNAEGHGTVALALKVCDAEEAAHYREMIAGGAGMPLRRRHGDEVQVPADPFKAPEDKVPVVAPEVALPPAAPPLDASTVADEGDEELLEEDDSEGSPS